MSIILAFVLIFSGGHFQEGYVVNDSNWATVAQCRADMMGYQSKLAAAGKTSKIGCFETTVPKED